MPASQCQLGAALHAKIIIADDRIALVSITRVGFMATGKAKIIENAIMGFMQLVRS